MHAAVYVRKGPAPEVLRVVETAVPEPSPGEVRVRVHASGVNPSDVKSRSGIFGAEMPFPTVIPHSDGAGVVDAVGDGVAAFAPGDRVWVYNAQWQRAFGTAAEYVVLPEALVVPLPSDDFAAGACLGIPAMTAHRAVTIDGPIDGATVLVQGGAGAVGRYAIQFAKAAGAQVLATISSPAKAAAAEEAGADACIDYRTDDVAAQVRERTGGRGVDRIIELDVAANGPSYPALLARGGTAVVYGSGAAGATLPVTAYFRSDYTLRFFLVYQLPAEARAAAIRDITAMLTAGTLRHSIAATFPLEQIADAHVAVEAGPPAGGNVIVTG